MPARCSCAPHPRGAKEESLNLGAGDLAGEGVGLVGILDAILVPGEHGAQLRADGLDALVGVLLLQLLEVRGAGILIVDELLGEGAVLDALQVVFHADIERQAGDFTMDDVADGEVRKMLFRHPHVFGGQETVQDADTVLEGWEAIKRREKGQQTTAQALDAVARSLPGLWRAEKLQSKAARDGFDWPDISGALDKLDEEVSELHRAAAGDGDVTEELGDVLFAAVKVGRFVGVDPEVAIHGTCEKFIRRYRAVEEGAAAMGRSVDQLPLETLEALWVEAKGS